MAASFIRVRLHFDYAPPAVVGCRMCWLLVDLRCCRVVADLEGMIRDRFDLSTGSVLRLFIEDCYLPHTESILLVRDNDCVRVKVESISKTSMQTSPEAASGSKSKRHRPAEDPAEPGATLEFKKKKRKKSCVVEIPAVTVLPEPETLAKTQKKKKKEKETKRTLPAPANALSNVKKSTKSPLKQKPKSSSSSSSSSSEDERPVKNTPKSVSKPAPTKAHATPKPLTNGGPALKKLPRPSSSSSSDTDSTSEDEKAAKSAKPKPQTEANATTTNGTNGNEEEEIELVIKKPLQHPKGRIMLGQPGQLWERPGGRGRGRGEGGGAGRGRGEAGGAGRGEGRGRGGERPGPGEGSAGRGRGSCVQYNYNEKERAKRPAAYSEDQLHNVSVVLQNGSQSLPRPDYSTMPLLAGPPQVGQKIAFKLLELTENYTPEVSGYKEGRILGFDPSTKQIELKLLTSSRAPVDPGKFDLVYQNPDGSESVEYAVDRGSLVTESWDSLLEPRLIL